MNKLVSIIVPVYNIENYLKECINSLLSQTYKNIEIILINDGSTDNSGTICNSYKKNSRIIKTINKPNNGVSSARNTGLKVAKGDYIMFVDSDDYVSENYIETFVNNIKEKSMVISSYKELFFNCTINHQIAKQKEVINNIEAINRLFERKSFGGYLWNKIFIKNIIDEHDLKFDESIHMCEDQLFVIQYLQYIKEVYLLPEIPYYYRMRKSSAVWKNNSKILTMFDSFYRMNDILQKKQIDTFYLKVNILENICKYKSKVKLKTLENKLQMNFYKLKKEIFTSKKISLTKKQKLIIIYYFPFLYTQYIKFKLKKCKMYN